MSEGQLVNDPVKIKGHEQITLAVTSAGAQITSLSEGTYDVWADAEVHVKVVASGGTASDVTSGTGYVIKVGNVVPFEIEIGDILGAVTATSTTVRLHRVR